jgi:hypothetical protein
MPLDAALDSAIRNVDLARKSSLASTLLAVADGVDAALSRCRWDTDALFRTVAVLGQLPQDSAAARLVLGAFFGHQLWRDRFSDCARRLNEVLRSCKPERQGALACAWVNLALVAVEEQARLTRSRRVACAPACATDGHARAVADG